MKVYFLNPSVGKDKKYIREGRCMQKASSWVTLWPPISLGILASIARKTCDVRLLDGNVEDLSLSQLIDDIVRFKPDLVVVNTGFPSIEDDMAVAKEIEVALPSVKVMAFGVYFTLIGREGMERYPFLDLCIIGEPEETFEEYLGCLIRKETDLSKVKGLGFRIGSKVVINAVRELIKDLDKIPFPARDLFKNYRYTLPHNNKVFTLINTARGCSYHCIFCIVESYYGDKLRKHSIGYVIDEIKECNTKYKIDDFLFWEEVFTLNRSYCLELCDAIVKNGLSIRWAATTRVDFVDEELLKSMKKAGCYLLGLGIESSSEEILRDSGKGTTIAAIERAVRLCKKAGIRTMGHFIFGLPGETRATAEATIRFMLGLGLDYMQCYSAVPYPGTPLGERAKQMGWVRHVPWSAYDFGGDSIMDLPTISADEVTIFRSKAFKRFYFRPLYMLKTVIRDVHPAQILKMFKFLDWMQPSSKKDAP